MSIKGLNKVINNLENIKNSLYQVNELFIDLSFDYIINYANNLLDKRLKNEYQTFGSVVKEWDKNIKGNTGILTNKDDNSAAIEFGIGIVGEHNPHNDSDNSGYKYNLPSDSKDENGNWTFYEPTLNLFIKTSGYEGKSFLYDSLMYYKDNKIYHQLYETAFDTIMKKVIKK